MNIRLSEGAAWAFVALCIAVVAIVVTLVTVPATHETKMKRLEIVRACVVQGDHEPEACRRLGSA